MMCDSLTICRKETVATLYAQLPATRQSAPHKAMGTKGLSDFFSVLAPGSSDPRNTLDAEGKKEGAILRSNRDSVKEPAMCNVVRKTGKGNRSSLMRALLKRIMDAETDMKSVAMEMPTSTFTTTDALLWSTSGVRSFTNDAATVMCCYGIGYHMNLEKGG
mmetsp:Transcript_28705/g.55266  ORF Transcript_28705/g.55266 Transcript_28705/m.55266 type:complete len:161 (+) Transcript_28705:649-1131(+)